ncbi:branched-chain amino acid ABC transporter permease [Chelatococcus asaccharovorans]|uniref:Amino acid/amide ABC transporter membrane protein 2 (HAAT family) n=1 Tax=Chelatococcus asaccharovorans TaxID=28210 RepID=A0A2V3UJF9_9HYPH|nr:branched-chain amino acid ABC transporter permease [Chelatococcus asaccharovorans]MBS7706045.1 branched-chain amino acid ABC transporter permease [Chelatococcus asaccharovorans]PXW59068.1 amino acid/amide ABC transporter membrane protein 2 (HAAT family) [Chelatococcus asaccharovorans]CAH1659702.1 Amino acid/amide ABC transporter membrane protein 2 (HAAT family) [Chelatococcus asaccharovorans]CAH1684095.1 Amino acid/amide ABC transporter membrane protein 2 (HAAT family) [Chelatococcus asaccha
MVLESSLPLPTRQASDSSRSRAARWLVWSVLAVVVTVLAPTLCSARVIAVSSQALMFGFLAMGTGFIHKHSGLLSFGHAVWFGLAGYSVGILATFSGLPIELAIAIGLVLVVALAALVAMVIMRSPGIAFSMLTLAINVAVFELFNRMRGATGGADGFSIALPETIFGVPTTSLQSPQTMFVIMGITTIVTVGALTLFERSHLGQLTLAIRENPERARFIGYDIYWPRVIVFVISAALAAIGGLLFTLYTGFVSPEVLGFMTSGQAMIMAMVGGTAAAWGPVAGALMFFLVRDRVTFLGDHWMLPLGSALIVVMAVWPTGLVGAADFVSRRIRGAARRLHG